MSIKAGRETGLVKAVKQYLELRGARVVRVNSGGLYDKRGRFVRMNSEPGCSDLLVCYRGLFIACEIKVYGGRVSPEQQSFLDSIRRAGGSSFVIHSIDEMERALESLEI